VFTSLSLLPAIASIAYDEDVFAQFKEYSKMWQLKKWYGREFFEVAVKMSKRL
jgi:hypothetical protein